MSGPAMFSQFDVVCEGCGRRHSFIYPSMQALIDDSDSHGWRRLGSRATLDHCYTCYFAYLDMLELETLTTVDQGKDSPANLRQPLSQLVPAAA